MRFGIPIRADRVAPRSTIAEALMLVEFHRSKVINREIVSLESSTWIDLFKILSDCHVDTMVCGGIDRRTKESLQSRHVSVIDNVACTADEVVEAIETGSLGPGYGFEIKPAHRARLANASETDDHNKSQPQSRESHEHSQVAAGVVAPLPRASKPIAEFDCLSCSDRQCLRGIPCSSAAASRLERADDLEKQILDAAMDITHERERTLCRLSEVIYFCLEMNYRRIGIAFCIDLLEPTRVLSGVLRRFFDVFPVGCKVGGVSFSEPEPLVACNPLGQAEILNRLKTDLNVIVGLCVGADCLFTKESRSPVSTLFVKDKSLANNPIGAIYSDYYLKEASLALGERS